MILNVSGRTDIVGFYSEWFMRRYEEGFVDVRNPFNPQLVSRIYFRDVDLIMFCTKNPLPIIDYLTRITQPIIFHVTLTPYNDDIEPNVIDKKQVIEGIKRVSEILGKENVVVRYDPVFVSNKYSVEYHKMAFDKMCKLLDGYVNKIIISFMDDYKNVRKNSNVLRARALDDDDDYREIGLSFSKSAKQRGMSVQTCFEEMDLVLYGFTAGKCLSKEEAYELTGKNYKNWTARQCGCVQMVDIGVYNSCNHLCKYCYANYDEEMIESNRNRHNPKSSLLIGELNGEDVIKVRRK